MITNMEDYFRNLNIEPLELLNTKNYKYDFSKAYAFLKQAVDSGKPISIIGDYDVDGITSTEELRLIIEALGGKCIRRIPKRFSEGYGLNIKILEEIPDNSYIITVDNGISATTAIEEAKKRGIQTLILDHHLPSQENDQYIIPSAQVVYDCHIDNAEFKEYCAAGMVYKLAEYIWGKQPFTQYLCTYAAIGTIADSVPLLGDNRNIVKEGLAIINRKEFIPMPIYLLMDLCGLTLLTVEDINFKIAPLINAPGRLDDSGAQFVSDYFAESNMETAKSFAEIIISKNDQRKKQLIHYKKEISSKYLTENTDFTKPLVIYYPDLPEGFLGLLAGYLSETYATTAFVMTNTDSGVLKGSARSNGSLHIKQLFETHADCFTKSGGHACAGGFSLLEENYPKLKQALAQYEIKPMPVSEPISIKQQDIALWYHQKQLYEPFGNAVPEPTFKVQFSAYPINNQFFETNGELIEKGKKTKSNLKLYGNGCDAFGFGLTTRYLELNCPKTVILTGKININNYNNKQQLRFQFFNMDKADIKITKKTLL